MIDIDLDVTLEDNGPQISIDVAAASGIKMCLNYLRRTTKIEDVAEV